MNVSSRPSVSSATPATGGDGRRFDLFVIGGGINGCGIARDAAGRGLSVMLVEQGDIASATSQWSTKLIHGGLRYLEYYEFRLVGEALREREILLKAAPHLIEPLQFVLPHEPHLRPRWMIRAGLFLYDFLGGRSSLPASKSLNLSGSPLAAGLKPRYTHGFSYYDARVDDARLTLANARGAADLGALIAPHTRFIAAAPDGGEWSIKVEDLAAGGIREVRAKALVNAAGPWVMQALGRIEGAGESAKVKHVKGSHIVVPRLHPGEHAYLLQNPDNRIIFIIPYLDAFSLIGTTDIPVTEFESPRISDDEIDYLCEMASSYSARPLTARDVVWTYSGVRPLYDDGASAAAEVTRDYVLKDVVIDGAPLLSIFGGKLTTYRRLAEHALDRLQAHLPPMGAAWTHASPLPGGDFTDGLPAFVAGLKRVHGYLPHDHLVAIARRHGSLAHGWLAGCTGIDAMGEHFGAGLYAREVEYLVANEWARHADDILFRRSKCGLMMSAAERERVANYVEAITR